MEYTEEEKQAIQRINSFKSIKLLYGKIYAMHLEQLKKYQAASEVILNLLEKYQKEIESKDKRINALQTIITKDLQTNQKQIDTFCGIPIEEATDIVLAYKNKNTKIYLSDENIEKIKESINTLVQAIYNAVKPIIEEIYNK